VVIAVVCAVGGLALVVLAVVVVKRRRSAVTSAKANSLPVVFNTNPVYNMDWAGGSNPSYGMMESSHTGDYSNLNGASTDQGNSGGYSEFHGISTDEIAA